MAFACRKQSHGGTRFGCTKPTNDASQKPSLIHGAGDVPHRDNRRVLLGHRQDALYGMRFRQSIQQHRSNHQKEGLLLQDTNVNHGKSNLPNDEPNPTVSPIACRTTLASFVSGSRAP